MHSSGTTWLFQSKVSTQIYFPHQIWLSLPPFLESMKDILVVWLFVCLFVCLFVWLFVLFCLFVCLFDCLFVCLSVCLFVCLFVCFRWQWSNQRGSGTLHHRTRFSPFHSWMVIHAFFLDGDDLELYLPIRFYTKCPPWALEILLMEVWCQTCLWVISLSMAFEALPALIVAFAVGFFCYKECIYACPIQVELSQNSAKLCRNWSHSNAHLTY